MSDVRDFVGHPIKVGDTVVYPVRRGSSMWMNSMKVLQIEEHPVKIKGLNSLGRSITLHGVNHVVVPAGGKDA